MISLGETLVATTIVVTVMGGVLGALDRSMKTFDTQPELSDLQQRLRVSVSLLQGELAMAAVPIMPYRSGLERPDPPGTFRRDVITVNRVRPDPASAAIRHVYYLRVDGAAGTSELMRYDGELTDMPVVDNVVKLEFQYFADGASDIPAEALIDGPWHPDDLAADRFDADLLRIRRVRVAIRVQAAAPWLRGRDARLFTYPGTAEPSRQIRDQEITFDVAPRNLNLDR
jgi:hypothetical protein